jgi:sulfatase modifying factor 1
MKTRPLTLLLCCLAALPLTAQTNRVTIFPDEDALTPENLKLVWPSTPGIRYEVKQSTNLQFWSTAPGYPATANGPAQQMPFLTAGTARFFQVRELDEQPPAIVNQYPHDGGFAVPRFANLTIQLSDVTGVDNNSIHLAVGALGTFTLANTNLSYTNGLLTFISGGTVPLGGWGSNVQATLIAADTLGNTGTNTWSFTLELQPQVVTNLFVFGSPQAQRAGQRIGNIPTAALAARFGPIPMGDGDPWTLELVESNRLVISYTNTAPAISNNTYLCNLTPATTDEIFYRKVASVSNNPAVKRLTLMTTDVPLAEILETGSASLSAESVIYDVGTNNVIIRAVSFEHTLQLPTLGTDKSGTTVYNQNGVTLTLDEAKWLFTPALSLAFETRWLSLQRFDAHFRGALQTALVPELTFSGLDLSGDRTFDLFSKSHVIYLGATPTVPPVPVWLDLKFSLGAEFGYNLSATATMSTGVRQDVDLTFDVDYVKDRSPKVAWNPSVTRYPVQIVSFTYQINGTASAYAMITPQIDLRVNSLAGVEANVDPRVEINGEATVSNGQLTGANWGIVAAADLNIGLSVIGLDNDALPALPPFNLFRKEWSSVYPPPAQLTILHQPQSQEVVVGSSATFSVDAVSGQPISYQWYNNGAPMIEKTGSSVTLNNVSLGHAGQYYVRLTSGGQTLQSTTATLTVRAASTPSGMALIPAGSFTMGDTFSEGDSAELPTHTVYVSAFYMDKYEVTKALWDEVYNWAITHGYSFDNPGLGKAASQPVHTVNWYDMVKWCNARSEKEGRTPAYYTDAGLTVRYRSGQVAPYVKWNSGYRLPTEAEWEKAARGGTAGHRFPWSNVETINHSRANYYSYWSGGVPYYPYDVNATSGYHPTFATGGYPYTSPVGYFGANGYGLYDMAGNVWEWCWDWYASGYYSSSPGTDPQGPATGSNRVLRGGWWNSSARGVRMANRFYADPTGSGNGLGFRSVLPPSDTVDTTGPSLTISSPADGSSVTNSSVTVSGTASDAGRGSSGIASATVNALRANNDTATGDGTANWSRAVTLSPGANAITVVATDGANNTTTSSITVTYNPPSPADMALIPAGSFTMGNCMDPNEGFSDELPLHTVYVSAFYMDKYEVTKALWDDVKVWNGGNGYSYENVGSGKATTHPVQTVNWRDCVKWCNARSEKEGLTPCYYNEAALTTIYKTGTGTPYPKWNVNGYRLPTEAEWEKAARGGASGHRFPWVDADTISWSRANYYAYPLSAGGYAYDVNPTPGFHPTFAVGGYLYTSPVGYFAANGYGLYDMAGNVWEWCWDWYGAYSSGSQTDPRGPASGSYRVLRGGGWNLNADGARCANRSVSSPAVAGSSIGLRCVRGL